MMGLLPYEYTFGKAAISHSVPVVRPIGLQGLIGLLVLLGLLMLLVLL